MSIASSPRRGWLVLVLSAALGFGLTPAVASEASENEEATEETHAAGHYHENHLSLFVGSTEPEDPADDRDFTLGFDYERRLRRLWGLGAMGDFVFEGRREYLLGPIAFLHPYRGLKLYAAPCYQRVREGQDDNLVIRIGAGWNFEVGKYSITPKLIYDFADEQNFLVFGVDVGRGF